MTRSLSALGALLLALLGVPYALLRLAGNPLPTDLSLTALGRALLRPDDGSVLLGLIAVIGWVAWAVFALSVLAEVVSVVSGARIRVRLPGLAAPQRLASGLILAVLALSAAPAVPHVMPPALVARADAAPTRAPLTSPPAVRAAPTAAVAQQAPDAPAATGRTHVVVRGDDLWSLATHYYGNGREWRQIATANPDLLTGGPDRLEVGWRLRIPGEAADDVDDHPGRVRVRAGETLSDIAEHELGSADRWPEVFRANRAQLDDPDLLPTGLDLLLPPRPARQESHDAPEPGPTGSRAGSAPAPPAAPTPAAPPPPVPPPAPASPQATDGPTAPSAPAPTEAGSPAVVDDLSGAELVLPLAGVGGLLAAGLVAALRRRRRLQLQARPLGRRIPAPPEATRAAEVALGRRQQPLSLRTLDRALRAVAASCRSQGTDLPSLQLALVGDEQIELVLAAPGTPAPLPFRSAGRSWLLDAADVAYLRSVPGLPDALRPWPALVTLGRDDAGRQVLADLEGLGLLRVEGAAARREEVLAAMALELSCSPWAEELALTLVGQTHGLPGALSQPNVTQAPDVELLLTRLERRAAEQRRHRSEGGGPAGRRLDPDLGEPWAPEIVLVATALEPEQLRRLVAVVSGSPRVATAAVLVGSAGDGGWALRLGDDPDDPAELVPAGLRLRPSRLAGAEADALVTLVETTGRTDTTPAPWWASTEQEPEPPPDNVTYLGRRFGGWAAEIGEGEAMDIQAAGLTGRWLDVAHPTLFLLGPVELLGATGTPPTRAGKQCLEYCGWLLEHPGRTAQSMASALAVAEGTRRSNMSRLRTWLGESPEGEPYLPDAYTGRIALHPSVSSDWQRLQILTASGVNRAGTDALRAALHLLRGAPLADAAPGQWYWAEELRTDMVSVLRDVGVELTERALAAGDVDLARWAAARALVAAPGDELLMAARIRTEHLAGNEAETERLTLQLAAQARRLGVDLDPQTVTLLQEVVEGQVRARLA